MRFLLSFATISLITGVYAASSTYHPLTTHVLDTSRGLPGVGVDVSLFFLNSTEPDSWEILAFNTTDSNGRQGFLTQSDFVAGTYKLVFMVEQYFTRLNETTFYPFIENAFIIKNPGVHYHVPILLSPYGMSTYRGS